MTYGRNDMQRINGLRIEEESRRRDEETQAQIAHGDKFDAGRRMSRFDALVAKVQRAVRR